tara:strand:- start:5189 stop:6211 length:1023 start_codon:yes stop_codon:yes gene_type:complete
MRINFYTLLFFFIFINCKTAYKTSAFDEDKIPAKPSYSKNESWAVLPGKYPKDLIQITGDYIEKQADVFYIYPTLFSDRKNPSLNADIFDKDFRNEIIQKAIKYQASAWVSSANLYAPFYRQAHYRIFSEPFSIVDLRNESPGIGAWNLAYEDLKNAFEYYLENYNNGKPIIIATHSQGTMHAIQLMKDYFDEKPLKEKLVAAYLIGIRILPNEFKSIKPMINPDDVGGFVSWNTYKMNNLPKEKWFKGGVTTNPISWNTKNYSVYEEHKGLLFKDGKIYSNSLKVQVSDGILWSTVPKIPGRIFLSLVKNYHYADINLFWLDISKNSQKRVDQWYLLNN